MAEFTVLKLFRHFVFKGIFFSLKNKMADFLRVRQYRQKQNGQLEK